MSELQFTTVDRVIAKFHRDIRGTEISESDLIEWIGEALEFLKVPQVQEQALAFLEVENHHVDIPDGFQMVIQIARNNKWTKENKEGCNVCPKDIIQEIEEEPLDDCKSCNNNYVITDCQGQLIGDYEFAYYRPKFDLKWEYNPFYNSTYYRSNYTPVRLADSTLYDSIVCKEKDKSIYFGNEDEYTIVGTTDKRLRFSFKDGFVVMAYIRNAVDEKTGYPLVPDNISYITAITYYIKWKIAEWYQWNGREGFAQLAGDNERKWLKYARQSKNWAKMPKSLDDFQDLLEQTHQLVPRHKRYYGFFGKVKRPQKLSYGYGWNK